MDRCWKRKRSRSFSGYLLQSNNILKLNVLKTTATCILFQICDLSSRLVSASFGINWGNRKAAGWNGLKASLIHMCSGG